MGTGPFKFVIRAEHSIVWRERELLEEAPYLVIEMTSPRRYRTYAAASTEQSFIEYAPLRDSFSRSAHP